MSRPQPNLEFGYFLSPDHHAPAATLALAHELDELGYDLIGIQDHPYQADHFDTLALIGVILGQTSRVRLFGDVLNLALRPPAMLAKAAATLDQLSDGRFELGLGAGGFTDAIVAMGGPRRTPAESVTAMTEAITIIRSFWQDRSVRVVGEQYQITGVRPGPRPAHDIGIWLGVLGPRMLALTGRAADGWVPSMSYVPPAKLREGNAIIDAAAIAAGRDPAAIARVYNLGGQFTARAPQSASDEDREIVGPVEHWVAVLTALAREQQVSKFILWGDPDPASRRRFIAEVAPAVRAAVATG